MVHSSSIMHGLGENMYILHFMLHHTASGKGGGSVNVFQNCKRNNFVYWQRFASFERNERGLRGKKKTEKTMGNVEMANKASVNHAVKKMMLTEETMQQNTEQLMKLQIYFKDDEIDFKNKLLVKTIGQN